MQMKIVTIRFETRHVCIRGFKEATRIKVSLTTLIEAIELKFLKIGCLNPNMKPKSSCAPQWDLLYEIVTV